MSPQTLTTQVASTSDLSGLFDTPMTPAEIITTVATIKKTKDMALWMQVQRDVWNQLVSCHFIPVNLS